MITTLNNQNVAITGALRKMTRATAFTKILCEGGNPQKKLTKATDILVVADEKLVHPTYKMVKAEEQWYTEIMSESDFYEIIGE